MTIPLIVAWLLVPSPSLCSAPPMDATEETVAVGQSLLRHGSASEGEAVFWARMESPELNGAQRLRLVANLNSVALAYRTATRFRESETLYRKILKLWTKDRLPRDKYE